MSSTSNTYGDGSGLSLSTPTRPRPNPSTSEGSIASRIGRRIGDLVYEMGHLALYPRSSPSSQVHTSISAGPTDVACSSYARQNAHTLASLRSPSTGGIQHQEAGSRAPTATSRTPLRTPLRIPSRSTSLPPRASPGTPSSARTSANPFEGLSTPLASPSYPDVPTVDWYNLYRDRLELQRRWADGRFTQRRLKGHEVRLLFCAVLPDSLCWSTILTAGPAFNNQPHPLQDSVYCIALEGSTILSGSVRFCESDKDPVIRRF